MTKLLEIKHLKKNYNTKMGEVEAIRDLSFDVYKGEFLSIVGTSGCGKSTLLNILANLDNLTDGEIVYKNDDLKIGYMLQEDSLFPWLSILDNATLGLDITHQKNEENINYVKSLLIKYGLIDFIEKYPDQLSGGMKQRVV